LDNRFEVVVGNAVRWLVVIVVALLRRIAFRSAGQEKAGHHGDRYRGAVQSTRRGKKHRGEWRVTGSRGRAVHKDTLGAWEKPARVTDELRWVVIGKMNEKHWSAVITRRSENVRIISVRRSRDEEIEIYESQDI
jgi:hypothetical protein